MRWMHRLPWPLPAILAWAAGWAAWRAGAGSGLGLVAGTLAGAVLALSAQGAWRRSIAAAGFPLSALALGADVPAWGWGLAAVPLALAYPLRAWRDAPFFPTPAAALDGLAAAVPLPPGARVLDAGCGIGHGLAALARVYPQARLEGIEWSRPLAAWAARRCPAAVVRRGDMWAAPWQGLAMVYLFQRPESMARAWAKACAEVPGGWLASLEFEVPGQVAHARLGTRPLWIYRIPAQSSAVSADNRR